MSKKKEEELVGKCDSFVVETDVHFPTDINLLFDAIRKVIQLTAKVCEKQQVSGWRQSKYNIRSIKKLYRKAQGSKKGKSKEVDVCNKKIIKAHRDYINKAKFFVGKSKNVITSLKDSEDTQDYFLIFELDEIVKYIRHTERQINQIERRVIQEEVIPHSEKVFSIFEPHTEWICKGKEGVPVELGLKVCVISNQYKFILHHHVMEHQVDEQVAISMVTETQERFPNFKFSSFDRGFYSANNRQKLSKLLDGVGLPKKGYISQKDIEFESNESFKKARQGHSRVESDINALVVHGLDRCLDVGLPAFKRYVAIAIAARNAQIIGTIIQEKEIKLLHRQNKITNTG